MLDEQFFKKVYYKCTVKPLIEEVYHKVDRLVKLLEANILATTEDGINEYALDRNATVGDPKYNNLNLGGIKQTKKEIEREIQLAKQPEVLSDGRTLMFKIYKVIDEMEKILIDELNTDKNISSIIWTCIDDNKNSLKNVYLKRFSKYNPSVLSEFDSRIKHQIATFIINRIEFLDQVTI